MGVAGWPVTGRRRRAFSTLLRRPGLRASNGGVLATTRMQNVSEYMLVLALCLVTLGVAELKLERTATVTGQLADDTVNTRALVVCCR